MIKMLFFIFILLFLIAIFLNIFDFTNEKNENLLMENKVKNKSEFVEGKTKKSISIPDEGVYTYIGMSSQEIKKILGQPNRIDRSSYDYDWWIYNSSLSHYIQVGILDNRVVTVYAIGESVNTAPFKIGEPISNIYKYTSFENTISLQVDHNSYRFELSEDDLNIRPLVAMGDVFVQLYFDKFTQTLSSIRYMDGETLIKQRPYELIYRKLISAKELTPKDWAEIEKGHALQILDITNVIRKRYKLKPVMWDEETAEVAFKHSKDMHDENYFSHDSPKFGGLADRLAAANIFYKIAGENIAAKYIDGIAAVEGWLNSADHRKTLLNKDFTHLGVGVYEKYYTQNFIEAWD